MRSWFSHCHVFEISFPLIYSDLGLGGQSIVLSQFYAPGQLRRAKLTDLVQHINFSSNF